MQAHVSGQFRVPLALANEHVQSLASRAPWQQLRLRRRACEMLRHSQVQLLDCGDGVRLQGFASLQQGRALVVLLHGWEGCAESDYMLSMGASLFAAGFDVFRLNFRDHGGTAALNPDLFHSCRIDEVVNAVCALAAANADKPLMLVGQSLGGNFALRVAARASQVGLDLSRVVAICPVLSPHSTMRALDEGWWVYRQYFLSRWRRSLSQKAAAFPDRYRFGNLARFRTLTDMTDFFVREYTDFADLDAYLSGYSLTGSVLERLETSTRVILAADDPVIPSQDLERIARPQSMQVDVYSQGGHCGFVDNIACDSWIPPELVADLSTALGER